jgi:GH3 auxin-responsive promoter
MNMALALNTAWMWKCSGALRHFHRATQNVSAIQEDVLRRIVRLNCASEFGQRHMFQATQTVEDFRSHVPVSTYDDYAEAIERIASGESRVLTSEPITLFEPTSGTSCGEKLIPFSSSLHAEFLRAINAWIADLMRHRPAVRRGRCYWSISPATQRRRFTAAGIPIGFEDDTQYLGFTERRLMHRLLAVPSNVSRLSSIENFRYCTLLHLVASPDLSLISIWSPTFLTSLLRSLEPWADRICRDLETGNIRLPDSSEATQLASCGPRQPRRADCVRSIIQSTSSDVERFQQIWPDLDVISCWTDASAGWHAEQLRSLFPNVALQSKGLLATECVVSFPLVSLDAPALAIGSHFFEFQEIDNNGEVVETFRLAHELNLGRTYAVVVTTGGGLYRYQLHDMVKVVGYANECPLLRFVGRTNQTSDLVGEKLSEAFVRKSLDVVFVKRNLSPTFAMLVPATSPRPHYRLYLECDRCRDASVSAIATELQQLLENNPHYRYAISLGQLDKLCARLIPPGSNRAWDIFERASAQQGLRIGDIKPTALGVSPEWSGIFEELITSNGRRVNARSEYKYRPEDNR